MSKRGWILLASAVPLLALFGLLGWASARSGGSAGSFGINAEFGQVKIAPEPAPEFSLELHDGGAITLSELHGKVVMVDFWSSWCPPCRREAPVLADVYREYRDHPVEFVGVAIWDLPMGVQEHLERYQVPYPNGIDEEGEIAIEYGVKGLPEKFFIDQQGFIAKKFVGPTSESDLREALDELLKEGLSVK